VRSVLIDVQFNPARNRWPALRDATLAAEAAGFDAAWVFDHIAGRSLGGDEVLEPFTLLGALAATTTSIALGTLVANVANRQPAVLAVGAASIAAIADRPVLLGIGAGSSPTGRWAAEMHVVGQPIAPTLSERHALVERTIDLVGAMWAADRGDEWATFPLPRWPVPVIVGASSVPLAQLAGRRAGGINVAWHHPRRDELLAAARTAYAAAGRTDGFAVTAWARWDDDLLDSDHPDRLAMAEQMIDRVVLSHPGEVRPDHIGSLHPR
jgi:alkanesulfonate monooxygenase SsuD/methylene tetrahydromethanopterin reductase-like flavin-dependent oxidoreductase (luciferase family)